MSKNTSSLLLLVAMMVVSFWLGYQASKWDRNHAALESMQMCPYHMDE